MSVIDAGHLAASRRLRLGEVARDDRERRHVERVDQQVQPERDVGVVGQPLCRVPEHDQDDAREAGVVPERHATALAAAGASGRRSAGGGGCRAAAAFAGSVMAARPPYPGCLDGARLTEPRDDASARASRRRGAHARCTRLSVSTGALRGVRTEGIDRYLGIPYAAPPFGDRRFQPPQPPAAWEGERDATAFGATAPQTPYRGGMEKYLSTVEVAGDDILTVNVWTPADRDPAAALPVLVFVHGGALTRGSAALAAYDGVSFARHGIVYVSIQYRIGQEGFAVLDDVPQNLGVLDQQAALRWVRREIGAFGGDPARVTVMGHSAGANTLTALLALPHAAELFDQAILQSGPLEAQPPKKAGRMTREIAKRLGVAADAGGVRRRRARRARGGADGDRRGGLSARERTERRARDRGRGRAAESARRAAGRRRPRHPGAHRHDQRGVPAVVRPDRCGGPHPMVDRRRSRAWRPACRGGSCAPTARGGRRRRRAKCSARSSPTCCCAARSRASPTAGSAPPPRPTSTSSAGAARSTGSARRTRWSSASSSTASGRRMLSPSAATDAPSDLADGHAPGLGGVHRRRRPGLGGVVGAAPGAGLRRRRRPHRLRAPGG